MAIDQFAAGDGYPLTSALEAQIANDHQWLHINAGGNVSRIEAAGSNTINGYNYHYVTSVEWASLFMQPFLVMRGLKQIEITYFGTIEAQNVSCRLELLGFDVAETVWVLSGTSNANVARKITLTLDEPAQVEYETDLILWTKSQRGSQTATLGMANIADGQLVAPTSALSTNPNRAIAAVGTTWGASGNPIVKTYEPLYRNSNGRDLMEQPAGVAVLSERVSGDIRARELEIARLTTRSIFVRRIYA